MSDTAPVPVLIREPNSRDGLLPALLAVQSAAPTLRKDATNPHFRSKYTPLDTIVETIGPLLAEHGLVWTTLPGRDPVHGDHALNYRLAHAATRETLEGWMPLLLSKPDAQGQGSAITYARRYALCAVLNLVADDDDDGNGASAGESSTPRMGSTPASDKQKGAIRREFTRQALTWKDIRALFAAASVPVTTGDAKALVDGLLKHQASALLDQLKQGALPTGESDIPANTDDFAPEPPAEGDVPWEGEKPAPEVPA